VENLVILLFTVGIDMALMLNLMLLQIILSSLMQILLILPHLFLEHLPLWYPDSGATHHITNDSSNLSHKVSTLAMTQSK